MNKKYTYVGVEKQDGKRSIWVVPHDVASQRQQARELAADGYKLATKPLSDVEATHWRSQSPNA